MKFEKIGTATQNQLSNDLYWAFYRSGHSTLRWSGYNDAYWWNNVAKSDGFQIRQNGGHTFKLNPATNEVFIGSD